MKFLVLKFLIIILYLITTSLSYSIDQPDFENIVINKDGKEFEQIIRSIDFNDKKFINWLVNFD